MVGLDCVVYLHTNGRNPQEQAWKKHLFLTRLTRAFLEQQDSGKGHVALNFALNCAAAPNEHVTDGLRGDPSRLCNLSSATEATFNIESATRSVSGDQNACRHAAHDLLSARPTSCNNTQQPTRVSHIHDMQIMRLRVRTIRSWC